jgi:hypothetical protein
MRFYLLQGMPEVDFEWYLLQEEISRNGLMRSCFLHGIVEWDSVE